MDGNWYDSLKSSSKKIILHNIRMYLRFCFSDEKEETEIVSMLRVKVKDLKMNSRDFLKLQAIGVEIDKLTEEKYNYIHGYLQGT